MSKRTLTALIFLGIGMLITTLLSFVELPDNGMLYLQKIFFGYDVELGIFRFINIQNLIWWAFFLGLAELRYRHTLVKDNITALKKHYLSESRDEIYTMNDIIAYRKNIANEDNLLANLIKALVLRYQASQKSVEETHQMLNSQLEMMQFRLDIDYNLIRYLTWIIPTLGFIGTVIGITLALGYAGQPGVAEEANFVSELTVRLSIAFYTTLVALVMSAILVFIMHLVQAQEETTIQKSGEYCLNNLVNKLTSPGQPS